MTSSANRRPPICRIGETVAHTAEGSKGLVADKRVIVAYASGGVPPGSAVDLASGCLRQVLAFIGIRIVTFVATEGIAADEPAAFVRAAEARARRLARELLHC